MNESELRAMFPLPLGRKEVGGLWALHLRALGLRSRRVKWLDTPAEADLYVNRPSRHREFDPGWAVRWKNLRSTVAFHEAHPNCSALMQKAGRMVQDFVDRHGWSEAWSTQPQWFEFMRSGVALPSLRAPEWDTAVRGAILPEPAPDSHAGGDGQRNAWSPVVKILRTVGCAWVLKDEIICVPNPETRLDAGGFLHAEDGPAVSWAGEEEYWFWHGVRVPRFVVRQAERITARQVLGEENAEVRRVMIERMGLGRFIEEAGCRVLDRDEDAGGPRELRLVDGESPNPADGGAWVAALMVRCPCTGRRYVLSVPPWMRTCREAAAWTFGFENPGAYAPVEER